jgi:phosphate:Na+ symporter
VQVFENEEVINYLNHNITGFLIKINSLEISEKDSRFIGALFHVINDIERIGDHAVNLAEAAQKSKNDGLTVSAEAAEELKNLFNEVITLLDRAIFAFDSGELSDAEGEELSELEENIDDLALACQDAHIFRLNRKECNTESGMLFMNTITDFERVGDHAINIAFLTKEAKGEEVKKM